MPTVLFVQGFRFFFYSNENDEPAHIHVEKADADGKIWLEPEIKIAYMHHCSSRQIKQIIEIVDINSLHFKQKWYEHFSK